MHSWQRGVGGGDFDNYNDNEIEQQEQQQG